MILSRFWPRFASTRMIVAVRASIARQVSLVLTAAGVMLLLLMAMQMATLAFDRFITTRLVDQRIAPMSQLQVIASGYQSGHRRQGAHRQHGRAGRSRRA